MSSPLKQNTTTIQELLNTINALPEEVKLPKLFNEGSASDLLSGKQLIDSEGNVVIGTYTSFEEAIIDKTLSNYANDRVDYIGDCAFYNCSNLTTVSFPNCTSIGNSAFQSCSSLTRVSFPNCTTIGNSAFSDCYKLTTVSFPACTSVGNWTFYDCSSLTTVSFPNCTTIGNSVFQYCTKLTTVSFPVCTSIGNYAFAYCSSLTTVSFPVCTSIGNSAFTCCYKLSRFYLTSSSLCNLKNSNAFYQTPFAGFSLYFSGTPYIYVPASLVDAYKSATNWTYFSSYISAYDGGLYPDGNDWAGEGEEEWD